MMRRQAKREAAEASRRCLATASLPRTAVDLEAVSQHKPVPSPFRVAGCIINAHAPEFGAVRY